MLTPVPSRKTQTLQIGDSAQVEEFYKTRFKDMQQTACKTIGKAFVKLVEPKKQTHHPYTKGDTSAPSWWPTNKLDIDHYVRHKEPDHLYKKERILLLVHILRMIVRPYHLQHPSVQKAALDIQKLDEFTTETMGTWFGDNDHPENRKKKAFLKEIFKVAKLEERYLKDEIDGTTNIPVAFGDRNLVDADESEDEGLAFNTPPGSVNGELEHGGMGSGLPTPESISIVSPSPMAHHEIAASDPRLRHQLPHRYNTHVETQPVFSEQPFFPRQNMEFQQSPTIPEPIRQRAFTSEDYHTNHSGLGWQQQSMVSPGSNTAPYYGHSASSAPYIQMGHTLPPPPSMMVANSGTHFDGLPSLSGRFNSSGPIPGTQFRTGSLGHPYQLQPQGFDSYLHENEGQYGQAMKEEPHQQQHHPHQNQHSHMQSQ